MAHKLVALHRALRYAPPLAPRARFLNSVAAKALFSAADVAAGEAMALRFTKTGDQPSNLTEMQAMWYEIEAGAAAAARRDYGRVRPATGWQACACVP